ncbi:TPM domain-containing protein [Sphingoaurantiacus capsulatus]|uniref:TPM domain-containing protein n=1 Tax=Sphingoaurantiacus capsulatus TaxID=1771310 RepID=A0ABV7X705_9SPHN
MATPALAAPEFPKLTGRVVDSANILPPDVEAALDAKLAALETSTTRQLVVATVPDLDGLDIADYGYQLGRTWGIGQKEEDNGALLIVAPTERRVRIEVGYGLEPILTDAMSSVIIQRNIIPRFREGDMPGGVVAGADAIIEQLQLPPEEAQANVAAAEAAASRRTSNGSGHFNFSSIIWILFILFWMVPAFFGRRGRRYRRGRGSGVAEAVLWGVASAAMNSRSSRGGGWGGGGGGFGGGGGSFGGGGASGSW